MCHYGRAKTGSLCCVAARPHGSNRDSSEWSIGPNEPHWRTNGSFSPPLSRRWDYRFHPEALPSGSHGLQLYGSSLSSTSKGSRSRISSDHLSNHQYSVSDGIISYFSSPSESFHGQHWNTMAQGINNGEFISSAAMSEPRLGCLPLALSKEVTKPLPLSKEGLEGTSKIPHSVESSSSHSDAGDSEQSCIIHIPSHRNFSGRYSFMSKPVYPITFGGQASDGEVHTNVKCRSRRLISAEGRTSTGWSDSNVHHSELKSFGGVPEFSLMQGFAEHASSSQRLRYRWSSGSSLDFGWDHESPDQAGRTDVENPKLSSSLYEDLKCALCERLLFQKSPWSSHRMVRTGDMPVAGVLSCSHVYHAECLEQTTPKSQKHDPPCPLCVGAFKPPSLSSPTDSVSVNELEMISTPVNKFPRFKVTTDDGRPSSSGSKNYHQSDYMVDVSGRKWGMQMSPHRSKSFLSKSRLRKHFPFKGKSAKEIPAVALGSRGSSSPLQVYPGNRSIDHFPIGCLGKDQYLDKW